MGREQEGSNSYLSPPEHHYHLWCKTRMGNFFSTWEQEDIPFRDLDSRWKPSCGPLLNGTQASNCFSTIWRRASAHELAAAAVCQATVPNNSLQCLRDGWKTRANWMWDPASNLPSSALRRKVLSSWATKSAIYLSQCSIKGLKMGFIFLKENIYS